MIDNITLEKHLKSFQRNLTIISLVLGLIASLGVCYGFYYNTNSRLDKHTTEIIEVKSDVKELTKSVNNSAVFQGASKEQIKALETQVDDIKNTQVRIEDKLDALIMQVKVTNQAIKRN